MASTNDLHPSVRFVDYDLIVRVATSWQHHFACTPDTARALAQELAKTHAAALVGHFYSVMLKEGDANKFLSHDMVEERLATSLKEWLAQVLQGGDEKAVDELIHRQHEVGLVHARIGIPAHLVAAGARMIKDELSGHIQSASRPTEERIQAIRYATNVIDLAIEVMIASYAGARDHSVQEETAYRYFVGLRHIGLERERQQSSLLEWENAVVYQLAMGNPITNLPLLSSSTFGLWFKHKGEPVFNRDPQSKTVISLISECDAALHDHRHAAASDTPEGRTRLIRELHDKVAQIKLLTLSMFEKIMEFESGRDELTHLLNRRFLPTVLRREIALAERGQHKFAVILLDLDHFKAINDQHGHAAGDLVLQSVASIILRNLRVSDYAFRYGGEEFLLVVVETDLNNAMVVANRIRKEIAREIIRLPGGHTTKVSVSVGLAVHNGHPDYAQLIDAADAALYRAKNSGRNQLKVADQA